MKSFDTNYLMCFFTVEELNIVLNSLAKWQGIYNKDQENRLNDKEKQRRDDSFKVRDRLICEIQDILQNKCHDDFLKCF